MMTPENSPTRNVVHEFCYKNTQIISSKLNWNHALQGTPPKTKYNCALKLSYIEQLRPLAEFPQQLTNTAITLVVASLTMRITAVSNKLRARHVVARSSRSKYAQLAFQARIGNITRIQTA